MIVMALLGGTEDERESMVIALMKELGASRVRRLYLGYLPDPVERVRRLRMELSSRLPDDVVTVVLNPDTEAELNTLRNLGAFVCHYYGTLSGIYSQFEIKSYDLMVSEANRTPDHVLGAVDAWSECYVRMRQRRLKSRAMKKKAVA